MEYTEPLTKMQNALWPGMRVLYIDDDEVQRKVVQRTFKELELFIYTKANVDMKFISHMSPHLIILDVGGVDNWQEVAVSYPDATVLFTGYASNGRIPDTIRAVVRDVIDKDDLDMLVECIQKERKNRDDETKVIRRPKRGIA